MTFTSQDVKDLVESLIPLIRKIANEETKSCIKPMLAQVISADTSPPTVRILSGADDGSDDITAENKYGFSLYAGQYVWLFYWDNLTNAFIGFPNDEVVTYAE